MSPESVLGSDYEIDDDDSHMDQNIDVVWWHRRNVFKLLLRTRVMIKYVRRTRTGVSLRDSTRAQVRWQENDWMAISSGILAPYELDLGVF